MNYEYEKEIKEAIAAGDRALASLKAALNDLESARGYGIWDMVGGGMISTMQKHSKMNNAKQNMENAKNCLKAFSRELQDVNMACNLNIETGDFLSFADWFFDGFFVDWMVQDRINTAKEQVVDAIQNVEYVLDALRDRR